MALQRELLDGVRALNGHDLRRLAIFVRGLLISREGHDPHREDAPSGATGKVTYRQEEVRCGRPSCTRCPHGPYWYAYWRVDGRLRSRYIGKELPPSLGVQR